MVIKKSQKSKVKSQKLKNKRILITAGPTWVPIDNVRVISNIATGQTGILLAKAARAQGAKVSLVLGPIEKDFSCNSIKIFRFRYFEELRDTLKYLLKNNKYDIIIHSAAVSDYRPLKIYSHKVRSDIKHWRINLVPTEKIIDSIKKINKALFLVGFKFEPGTGFDTLIKRSKRLLGDVGADLVVANTVHKNRYLAYILDQDTIIGPLLNKNVLTKRLIKIIGEKLWNN